MVGTLVEKSKFIDANVLPFNQMFESLQKGENVLIETGNQISLLKYEGSEVDSTTPWIHRVSRNSEICCMGNFSKLKENDPSKRIVEVARGHTLGTHKIVLTNDEEFNLYLPSADDHTDSYLTLANKFGDGRVERNFNNLTVITDESSLTQRLKEITRPDYFEQNIIPFLENRNNYLKLPNMNNKSILRYFSEWIRKDPNSRKPIYRRFNRSIGQKWLSDVAKDLKQGDFLYVGSNEEVYLLGVAKDNDSIHMQGTYTTSTKPMLWFSNNSTGGMNNSSMRNSGFEDQEFIFTAMGRSQNCRNHLFNGEPDIITGDLSEAMNHFKITDFKEFEDLLENYAKRIHEPTPNVKPNSDGKFFY